MAKVLDAAAADIESTPFALNANVKTVRMKTNTGVWGAARVYLMIETDPGSGEYVIDPSWEMSQPGAKNIVSDGNAGLRGRLRLRRASSQATFDGWV